MSITKEQIIDAVATLSVMEVVELITLMEEKFGVSAAAPVALGTAETQAVEEQTEFKVILTAIGNNKVPVIKVVRNELGLGLQEAKSLVESVPATLKEGITKEQADALKKIVEEVGATVEIK